MRKIFTLFIFLFYFIFPVEIFSQDTVFIKVHFLYGSKPARKYKGVEEKWFGGKPGGHVGIETDSNRVLNFLPSGTFHWFAKKDDRHSSFAVHATEDFFQMFGTGANEVKRATVVIPVSKEQKKKLDSIYKEYRVSTPYDYAFIGMRCGAAAYEILGQLNILKPYSYRKTYRKIFYPKKLRKRLFKKAKENKWQVVRQEGTERRKWERD